MAKNNTLSEYPIIPVPFPEVEKIVHSFHDKSFLALTLRKRFRKINQTLLQLIQQAPTPSFLLGSVIDFMDRINAAGVLTEPLTFSSFEFWLNHFSELSDDNNYIVRAKICGKFIPRAEYQAFFPIGMNRVYGGSHFVSAHQSPDVDTMIASFWGWIDAFAARVGTGLHQWSLPEGPPDSPVTVILKKMFGEGTFHSAARKAPTLTLNAMDLVTQRNWTKEQGHGISMTVDQSFSDKALTLVNDQGHYLGDWRSQDFETVRQVSIHYKSCLRWFENNFHTKLVSLFARAELTTRDLPSFCSEVFDVKIKDCEPAHEFTDIQKSQLDDFFKIIIGIPNGLSGTYHDLISALHRLSLSEMNEFQILVESLAKTSLFDTKGKLVENRPAIFHLLEHLLQKLDAAMKQARNYVERLDVALKIKHQILQYPQLYLTLHSDVEEMRNKMQNFDFLTVVIYEQDGSLFPVGIVRDADLQKTGLGTVSFRDFCNFEEVKMASYLEVISVVDHHKSILKTFSVPCALIGDAQSCNVLIAEQAFIINDHYSLGGLTPAQIDEQIKELMPKVASPKDLRILQRLLQRQEVAKTKGDFFINPQREASEYFIFLQAILDDTDLLSKVSKRDIDCIVQLLNRLTSLNEGRETEIITLDDIPKDKNFAKVAAQRILQNPAMYVLYKSTFGFREREVEHNLELCGKGQFSNLFVDTKEQNGCARVGQTKIFNSNYSSYQKHAAVMRSVWFNKAQEVNSNHPEIDLHMHMVSTIPSADEVFKNQIGPYSHFDEAWIWIPSTQMARDHLISFLSNFQNVTRPLQDKMSVEFMGANAHELESLFTKYFLSIPMKISKDLEKGLPIAILRYPASSLNSRKAMITPFIPRLLP